MYDQIASYYDLIHAALTADVGFVLTLASRGEGPILELGCGTGRLLLPLARAGHAVTGLDNSSAMLARARRKVAAEPEVVRQRVALVEGDMTNFDLGGRFALALISHNTLMHLAPTEMAAALQCVRGHLRPDGRLFIDLINPLAAAQTPDDRLLTLERSLVDPATGEVILQMTSSWVDQSAQVLHVTWVYDASGPAGGEVRRMVFQAMYHYLYPHELELLLETAGFRLEALYGDYNQRPYEEDSQRMLALAKT